jgi:PAS domain S-box-containing protein
MRERQIQPSAFSVCTNIVPVLLTNLAGLYATIGGILTLIGWAIPYPRFTDWAGHGISMFPNAAMCSISGGIALLLLNGARGYFGGNFAACLFGCFTAIVGGLSAYQHLTGVNLGIDEFLFEGTWGQAASAAPMRMGVPASFSFLLLGSAVALAAGSTRVRCVAAATALLPIAIASLSLIGYWFGASLLYGVGRYTGIAWQTASIIFALGVGLVAALRECGFMAFLMRPDAGGHAARRLLIPIIAIPLVLGRLRVLGTNYGIFDDTFGTALRSLCEIFLFLGFLWWTSRSISKQAAAAIAASNALQASDRRFTRFMQSLPGMAWIKDAESRYVYANDAARKVLRNAQGELYGLTDADVLPADTAAVCMEHDRLALQEPDGLLFIETMRLGDSVHSLLVSKFPIPGPDGAPTWVGGMAIDITDRLRAEEELKEAHRRKDEFIATLAHELRNPLSPIHFSVEICRSQADAAKRDWALNSIDRQVQQMSRILDDLLDLSRISHGKLSLRLERVELADIVTSAVETSLPLRKEVGQSLDIELPDQPVFLQADPVRLEQVFANLLNNAAKYGGRDSRVTLKATTTADRLIVSIRDQGIGIPKDRLVDIFEMFSQVKSSSSGTHAGLGIGLSLVKGLVNLHSGEIEARSEGVGMGSEFIVRLPLSPDFIAGSLNPADRRDAVSGSAAGEPFRRPLRILIADDMRDSADSLTTCFRSANHVVRTVYDGAEALAQAEDFRPDIMFLDIGMPKLCGNEVCRRIREKDWGKHILMVAITGWGQEKDRLITSEAGFNHHLVKPVKMGELLTLVAGFTPEP